MDEGLGCRLRGFVSVIRVPGNFHIGHHGFGDIVRNLVAEGYKLDNSFRINQLSFGTEEDFKIISENFPDAGIMHPLNGFTKEKPESEKNMHCGFYLNAVPAIFE